MKLEGREKRFDCTNGFVSVEKVQQLLRGESPTGSVFFDGFGESGAGLAYIQDLLGHSGSKTAEVRKHVSDKLVGKILNPTS